MTKFITMLERFQCKLTNLNRLHEFVQGSQRFIGYHLVFELFITNFLAAQRFDDAKVGVHRLEMFAVRVRYVVRHGTDHRFFREDDTFLSVRHSGGIEASQQAAGGTLDIAFHSGHLASEEQIIAFLALIGGAQYFWRVKERIPVHNTVTHDFSIFQSRDHLQDPLLLSPLQVSLKPTMLYKEPAALS